MHITKNTLKLHYEKWTDPGDYPSNAGSCRLPDREAGVVSVSGEIELGGFTADDMKRALEDQTYVKDYIENYYINKFVIKELEYVVVGNNLRIRIFDVEPEID